MREKRRCHTTSPEYEKLPPAILAGGSFLLCSENHSLGEWFQKAYAMREQKNSLCYNESAVCQLHKR